MALNELVQLLDDEREALFQSTATIKSVYHTLAESLRTLTVPFRNAFSPEASIESGIDANRKRIEFVSRELQSLEGEAQNNSARLIHLINNLYSIQNSFLQSPYFVDLQNLEDIRHVHNDIRAFLQELYDTHSRSISNTEMSTLAQQKRRDIDEILNDHINPFFDHLEEIKNDEYTVRLRPEIKDQIVNYQNYTRSPEQFDELIRDRCTTLGLDYAPELTEMIIRDLELSEETLKKRIQGRYLPAEAEKRRTPAAVRRRYLKIIYRFLGCTPEVSKLLPILENIYYLYQPKPSFAERLGRFLARLFGKDKKLPKRDVDYSYIIGKEGIQRKNASLEEVMTRVNTLEKLLLKVKNNVSDYTLKKQLGSISIRDIRNVIENISTLMEGVFDDSSGLIQWLGKRSNRDKLEKIPANVQKELHQHLNSLHASLIINTERLREIARKYPS